MSIETRSSVRLSGLDRARGFAIVMMMGQHVGLLIFGWNAWQATGGRLIAPIFFVVGGSLVTRMTRRHGYVAAVGVLLSVAIPWAGSPSSLLLYSLGALVVWAARRRAGLLWLPVLFALMLDANGYGQLHGAYAPAAVVGLMCAGALIGRAQLAQLGARLPAWSWLAFTGRHPLAFYVGHLSLLEVCRALLTS